VEGQVMPQFSPDQVTFDDGPGLGMWDDSHHREHQQFVEVLAQQTPAVLIPNYDFLQMLTAGSARRSIVESHNQAHAQLRQVTGVAGTDYSQYDLSKPDDFYNFTGYHSSEHAAIRQALGIM
jgi:hypothetical protein